MLEALESVSGLLLLALSGWLVALCVLGAYTRLVKYVCGFERRLVATLSVMEQDMRMLGLASRDAEGRLRRAERTTASLRTAQQQLESRGGTVNYGQAISLVQRGWRKEDLVSTCGLTHGEADLVYLLHGPGGKMADRQRRRTPRRPGTRPPATPIYPSSDCAK